MKYIALLDTEICDLFMIFNNGVKTPIKVKKGEEVPVDFLDKTDVEKSLKFGALKNLINAKIIIPIENDKDAKIFSDKIKSFSSPAEIEAIETNKNINSQIKNQSANPKYTVVETMDAKEFNELREAKGLTETVTMNNKTAIQVDPIEFDQAVVTDKSGGLTVVNPETKTDKNDDTIVTENDKVLKLEDYTPKTDLSKISTISDFINLNHFDQLLIVKNTENKELLNEIIKNSNKIQIINNAKKRLRDLK